MARVPGLTSMQDQPGRFSQATSRVASPDAMQMRPNALTATARPVDTYSRPEAPDQSNSFLQLAQTLSDINPSIQKFMGSLKPDPNDSAAKARQLIQTTDPKVLAERMKSKDVPVEFQNLEGMRVYAEQRAYEDLQEATRRYNEDFDKDGGDVNELMREVTSDAFEQYGDDRAFREVYTKTIQSGWDRLRSGDAEYKSTRVMEQRTDSVFNAWYGRIDNMTAEGKPPAEVVESIMGDIPKNRDFLKLHPKDQQKMILQLASQQATKGNYDVAKTLLSYERADGPYKGSLLSDNDLGEKAQTLLGEIEATELKARLKVQSAEAEDQLYGNALKMVEDGSILAVTDATIPDEKGEPKVIPAETIKKQTAVKLVEEVKKEAEFRGEDATQAHLREKQMFVGSGLEHPVWFQSMNSAYTQASTNNITQGKLPPTLIDGFKTYDDLYKDSPQYVGKYLNAKAMDFYDTARVVMEGGLADTEEGALRIAQTVTRNPNENDALTNQRYEDIDGAVTKAISSSSGFWSRMFGGPAAVGNGGYVKDSIVRSAKLFARAGLSNEEALTKASETFQKTHVNVAGTFLKADKRMPNDFSPLVEQYITEFAAKYGEAEGFDASDLTIYPAGNGTGGYFVANRSTYMPADPDNTESYFSINTLDQLRTRNRTKKVSDVVKEAETR